MAQKKRCSRSASASLLATKKPANDFLAPDFPLTPMNVLIHLWDADSSSLLAASTASNSEPVAVSVDDEIPSSRREALRRQLERVTGEVNFVARAARRVH